MEELRQLEAMNREVAQQTNFTRPRTGERPKSLQEKAMIQRRLQQSREPVKKIRQQ